MKPSDERKRRESAQLRISNSSDVSDPRSIYRFPTSGPRLGGDVLPLTKGAPWSQPHRIRGSMTSRTDNNLPAVSRADSTHREALLSSSSLVASSLTASSLAMDSLHWPPPSTNLGTDDVPVPNALGQKNRLNNTLPDAKVRNNQVPLFSAGGVYNYSAPPITAINPLSVSDQPVSRVVGSISKPSPGVPKHTTYSNPGLESNQSVHCAERDDKSSSTVAFNAGHSDGRGDGPSEKDHQSRQADPDLFGDVEVAHRSQSYFGAGLLTLVWIGQWCSHKNKPQNERLALKTFHGSCLMRSNTFENDLWHEARSWMRFDHENILLFLGICGHSLGGPMVDAPVLVTPYCSNGNIRVYLKEYSETNSAERIKLIHQIANGLHYLHGMQYVHGNLKGSNILIDEGGIVRITDYGLTRLLGPVKHSRAIRSAPQWAAPELVKTEEVILPITVASDVWAFGMVVLEIMTNKDPWHPASENTVLDSLRKGSQPKRQNYPDVTEEIWAVLKKCWEFDARRRPNISKVQEELREPPQHT